MVRGMWTSSRYVLLRLHSGRFACIADLMMSTSSGFTVYAKHNGHIYFDVLRALQGIGPAILLPNGVALLGRFYPPGRRKDMAFSFFGLTAPLGFMLGATFSSLIGQLSWWPWIYWVHAIVCFIAAALSWITIPTTIDEDNPSRREKGALDVPGCLTGVSGLILINFSWNQGAVVGWETVYVYVTLLLGILAMGAFCKWPSDSTHRIARSSWRRVNSLGREESGIPIGTFKRSQSRDHLDIGSRRCGLELFRYLDL
jgi:MFS family permease